jgi:hypothetical protein
LWRRRVDITKAILVVVRDILCLGLGAWGIIIEETSTKPELNRLIFFAIVMVAPLTFATWFLAQFGTVSPSLQRPSSSQPELPSSGSSNGPNA